MTIQSGKTLPGPTCHTSPSSVTLSLPRHTYTFSLSPVHALGQAAMEAEADRAAGDAGGGQRAATRRCPTTPAPSRSSPLRLHVPRCRPLPLAIARLALVADDARERGGERGEEEKEEAGPDGACLHRLSPLFRLWRGGIWHTTRLQRGGPLTVD